MGRVIVYALVAVIMFTVGFFIFIPEADGKPDPGNVTKQAAQIERLNDRVCRRVTEYTDCKDVTVFVGDYGSTSWAARSHPSTNTVWYNTYYDLSKTALENLIAHEVGGHLDTWNEIVAKVGVNQAWTDYYDIDYYAQVWLQDHGYLVDNTVAKELWLDCAGPTVHGYTGYYLLQWNIMPSVCDDHRRVLDSAISD